MSKTITQLTETQTHKTNDLLIIHDTDNNQDKSINVANLFNDKPHGEAYANGNSTTTTISVAGTKVNWTNNGATTSAGLTNKFTHTAASGRLTYTGEEDINVEIVATLSVARSGAVSSNEVRAAIYVDGAIVTKSELQALVSGTTATPDGARAMTLKCLTTLSQNSYVEVYIANQDDTTDQVVSYLNLTVKAL